MIINIVFKVLNDFFKVALASIHNIIKKILFVILKLMKRIFYLVLKKLKKIPLVFVIVASGVILISSLEASFYYKGEKTKLLLMLLFISLPFLREVFIINHMKKLETNLIYDKFLIHDTLKKVTLADNNLSLKNMLFLFCTVLSNLKPSSILITAILNIQKTVIIETIYAIKVKKLFLENIYITRKRPIFLLNTTSTVIFFLFQLYFSLRFFSLTNLKEITSSLINNVTNNNVVSKNIAVFQEETNTAAMTTAETKTKSSLVKTNIFKNLILEEVGESILEESEDRQNPMDQIAENIEVNWDYSNPIQISIPLLKEYSISSWIFFVIYVLSSKIKVFSFGERSFSDFSSAILQRNERTSNYYKNTVVEGDLCVISEYLKTKPILLFYDLKETDTYLIHQELSIGVVDIRLPFRIIPCMELKVNSKLFLKMLSRAARTNISKIVKNYSQCVLNRTKMSLLLRKVNKLLKKTSKNQLYFEELLLKKFLKEIRLCQKKKKIKLMYQNILN